MAEGSKAQRQDLKISGSMGTNPNPVTLLVLAHL